MRATRIPTTATNDRHPATRGIISTTVQPPHPRAPIRRRSLPQPQAPQPVPGPRIAKSRRPRIDPDPEQPSTPPRSRTDPDPHRPGPGRSTRPQPHAQPHRPRRAHHRSAAPAARHDPRDEHPARTSTATPGPPHTARQRATADARNHAGRPPASSRQPRQEPRTGTVRAPSAASRRSPARPARLLRADGSRPPQASRPTVSPTDQATTQGRSGSPRSPRTDPETNQPQAPTTRPVKGSNRTRNALAQARSPAQPPRRGGDKVIGAGNAPHAATTPSLNTPNRRGDRRPRKWSSTTLGASREAPVSDGLWTPQQGVRLQRHHDQQPPSSTSQTHER